MVSRWFFSSSTILWGWWLLWNHFCDDHARTHLQSQIKQLWTLISTSIVVGARNRGTPKPSQNVVFARFPSSKNCGEPPFLTGKPIPNRLSNHITLVVLTHGNSISESSCCLDNANSSILDQWWVMFVMPSDHQRNHNFSEVLPMEQWQLRLHGVGASWAPRSPGHVAGLLRSWEAALGQQPHWPANERATERAWDELLGRPSSTDGVKLRTPSDMLTLVLLHHCWVFSPLSNHQPTVNPAKRV